jgi:hypothetical protein
MHAEKLLVYGTNLPRTRRERVRARHWNCLCVPRKCFANASAKHLRGAKALAKISAKRFRDAKTGLQKVSTGGTADEGRLWRF